jgi:hypothetical protein
LHPRSENSWNTRALQCCFCTPAQASALRFFFTITPGRADLTDQLARTHYPRIGATPKGTRWLRRRRTRKRVRLACVGFLFKIISSLA